ncbi:MAG TPA: serine hydrolase domain-containing protein [Fimbriimonadaceae bacterium]|nr:serine hydrolase domain-containing protein [Fimbriimonadaceae bacterium]
MANRRDRAFTSELVRELYPGDPAAPGLCLLVAQGDHPPIRIAVGFADLEGGAPVTSTTNFRLASVTKQFTAAAILLLVHQGRLSLEGRLSKFFPAFPAYGSDAAIRQLLNHTAGLPDYAEHIPEGQCGQLQDGDILQILCRLDQPRFPPGTRFEYSNSAYVILGVIVEQVSGQPLRGFFAEHLFEPVGMKRTVLFQDGVNQVSNRAFGYTPRKSGDFIRTDQNITSATLGDGGVYSSIDDLLLWDQAITWGGVLPKDLLNLAMTPNEAGYGFGWFIDQAGGITRIHHPGSTVGFRTHYLRVPEHELTIIALMNRSDGRPLELINRIAAGLVPGWSPLKVTVSDCL